MKRKVKKYAGGTLVDSSGNPVRSGSGDVIRTRSDDEIAEDMKRPMGQSMPRSSRSSSKEDRPTSSGVEDYSSMGKRAGATSTWSGAPTIKEETTTETETPTAPSARASDEESVAGKGARNLALEEPEVEVKKKTIVKKKAPKYEDTGAKIGSQSFSSRGDDKKVPPLRKIGEAIMGTMESASKPYRSSMYDKMKGRKAGGSVKMASGGKTSSASSRGDGIAQRGKTRGRIC